ncbi:hypothetical protein [uncultured Gammaproteobacteria bacterium]|nr:hypothetical protein [uncultured Gammaproteobacteria bacterium]
MDFANHPYLCKGLMTIKKIKKPHNRGSVNEISRPICTYYL